MSPIWLHRKLPAQAAQSSRVGRSKWADSRHIKQGGP